MNNNAPQNIRIKGTSSRTFKLECLYTTDKISEDNSMILLFIESIMQDFMDSFGDTFKANIVFNKKSRTINITLEYPEYHWISDVGCMASAFIKKLENDKLYNVTIEIPDGSSFTCAPISDITFGLIAKDGVYIERKKTEITQTIKRIDDHSFFHGYEVPNYDVKTCDF